MTKIVEIKDYLPPDFVQLPIIKPHDMPVIQGMKDRV